MPTIYQKPNKEVIVTVAAGLVGMFTTGWVEAGASALFYLAGTAWAYLEIREGANWVRRGMGLAFVAYLLVTLAMRLHNS